MNPLDVSDLYAAYQKPLVAIAYRTTSDRQTAEDLVQDVFLTAHERITEGRFDGGAPWAWLQQILRHKIGKHLQRHPFRKASTYGLAPRGERASDEPAADDTIILRERIAECLAMLTPAQAEAVTLQFLDGLKPEDAARKLGISVVTLRARIYRGRKTLTECLRSTDG